MDNRTQHMHRYRKKLKKEKHQFLTKNCIVWDEIVENTGGSNNMILTEQWRPIEGRYG